jgi:CPA2 family monovalent cation:H+ antiporter-2
MTHDLPVLRELVLLAGCSLAVILLFRRVKLPPVVGFLVTGILLGPGGFGLVRDPATISTLAEIGVVLLLFTVGLEFSIADLRKLGAKAALAGILQVLLTASIVALVLLMAGAHPARAIFFGLLLAPSSTALLFRLITDRGELQAPHGKLITAVLLVQDLAVVPMAMLIPTLAAWTSGGAAAGTAGSPAASALRALGLIVVVVAAFFVARKVAPWLLARASRGRSRETFLAAVVLVALGSAFLSEQAGLSLALGAFLAGLILAESDLRSQVIADILPFRDTFSSVFFISVGMMLLPRTVAAQPLLVLAATVGMVLWKLVAASLGARISGFPWRTAFAAGLGLAHVGEFSFVLAQQGMPAGLLPAPFDQAFFAGAVFSMMITPWLVTHAPEWALRVELFVRSYRPSPTLPGVAAADVAQSPLLNDHVVIAGFGLNGQNLARVLRATHIAHVVLDMAPEAIARCAAEGSPAIIGNATQDEILRRAGIARARVLVLALSDLFATRHATRIARGLSRGVFILVRTRAVSEIDELYQTGANLVIPEEFETSIEIFTSVLREYHVPNNVIEAQIVVLRQERYSILRGRKLPRAVIEQLDVVLTQGTTEAVVLLHHSPAIGKTLAETGLLEDKKVQLVALIRAGRALTTFDPSFVLRVGDTLVVTGNHGDIDKVMEGLAPPLPSEES